MPKNLFTNARSYAKNVGKHVGRIATRSESVREAVTGVSRDTLKMKRALSGDKQSKVDRKRATQFLKRGREEYNHRRYEQAETYFRQAIFHDPKAVLAHLYLGHSLYKLGHHDKAVRSWEQVIENEPGSAEATKAKRKIRHVEKRREDVVKQLATRIKRGR